MIWRVEEYIAEDGSIPYRDWFDGLDVHAAAKVATAVLRMEMGNTSSVKWFGGIGEYRIDWGPGYRIYLMRGADAARAVHWRHQTQPAARPQASHPDDRCVSGPAARATRHR